MACKARGNEDYIHDYVSMSIDRPTDLGQQLVPQADAKDRLRPLSIQHASEVLNRLRGLLGVSGPVAEEKTVVLCLIERVVPGHHIDAGAAFHKAADLVVLHAAVDSADARKAARVNRVRVLQDAHIFVT